MTADPDNTVTALWSGEHLLRALRIDLLSLLVCASTAFSGGCADSRSADALAVEIAIAEQPVPAVTGAIIPAESAAAGLEQCTREIPARVSEFWSPEPPVIAELEARLPTLLDSVFDRVSGQGEKHPGADEYYRQYVGIVHADGQRAIYVNAFRRDYLASVNRAMPVHVGSPAVQDTFSWRSVPVSVCDGGITFFGVEYDPRRRGFGRLEFNHRVTGPVRY